MLQSDDGGEATGGQPNDGSEAYLVRQVLGVVSGAQLHSLAKRNKAAAPPPPPPSEAEQRQMAGIALHMPAGSLRTGIPMCFMLQARPSPSEAACAAACAAAVKRLKWRMHRVAPPSLLLLAVPTTEGAQGASAAALAAAREGLGDSVSIIGVQSGACIAPLGNSRRHYVHRYAAGFAVLFG